MTHTPLIIVNPRAAGGRAGCSLPSIRAWLAGRRLDATLVETRERGHAEQLAADAAAQGHDRVVSVGGDGTFQEVVNGLRAAGDAMAVPSAGLVPVGRGNDVARGLRLPTELPECLEIALGGTTRPFDLVWARGEAGYERCFAAAGGAGFDAQVAYTMEMRRRFWMRGEAGYMLATLNELRRFRNHALTVTLRGEEGERTLRGRFLFVAFANGPYYGGGMQICPGARTDDGLLDVCLVGDLSRLAALRELPGIYAARHVKHPQVQMVRARSIRIEGEGGTRVHLDGEPFGSVPVEIGVRPGAVRIACSKIDES